MCLYTRDQDGEGERCSQGQVAKSRPDRLSLHVLSLLRRLGGGVLPTTMHNHVDSRPWSEREKRPWLDGLVGDKRQVKLGGDHGGHQDSFGHAKGVSNALPQTAS